MRRFISLAATSRDKASQHNHQYTKSSSPKQGNMGISKDFSRITLQARRPHRDLAKASFDSR
jgi:hypothetical protein